MECKLSTPDRSEGPWDEKRSKKGETNILPMISGTGNGDVSTLLKVTTIIHRGIKTVILETERWV